MRLYFFLYICGMKILICDISELGEEFVERCMGLLPDWRKEQMLKIKHLKGRVQCAVGFLLVWRRDENNSIPWRYNKYGKPYFADRDDLFFSVSHCGSAVAVAIDDEEVGIDIEEIARYKERLIDYVANEAEGLELREEFSNELKAEKFIELWTKKEAAFKLLGTGITHEIKDILKRDDFSVFSRKIGDKYLSVASYKRLDDKELIINDVTENVKKSVKIY